MVIGFAPKNGHRAVDLLDGHYSYHLMAERHLGEGYLAVSSCINGMTETVGTTDDEGEVSTCIHFLLQPIGILDGAELLPMFIEQDYIHSRREAREDGFAFGRFELVLTQRFGIFDIRNEDEIKGKVVLESVSVFVDEARNARVSRLPNCYQCNRHR